MLKYSVKCFDEDSKLCLSMVCDRDQFYDELSYLQKQFDSVKAYLFESNNVEI